MTQSIDIAVLPVAGFGTRFLPATKASPKEMLPVVDKPLIQYAVDEAYAAGIRTMVFVTGRNKWSITEHYDVAYELENELAQRNKQDFLQIVRAIKPDDMHVVYIRQELARGLGHAVLCARPVVRDRPFAVLLADDLLYSDDKPVMQQMVEVFDKHQQGVLGVHQVPRADTGRYGIVTEGARINAQLCTVEAIVEKPDPDVAPSQQAVIGRYILPGQIMHLLAETQPDASGEIQLTDAISRLIHDKTLLAYRYDGVRYDCGDKLGYLKANVEMGLRHGELGQAFAQYLQSIKG